MSVGKCCANSDVLAALVCSDCQNKVPQPGKFKQQNRTLFSSFWRLEVQEQAAGFS